MTLNETVARLTAGGIENARGEARMMFRRYAASSDAELYGGNPASDSDALRDAIGRRLSHEPLAYILGEVAFFRETYLVTPDCLIPRSDTELLVEEAIRRLPHGIRFADLCTGSGCIAVSVLANRTDLTADAYDVSEAALNLARKNAVRNGTADRTGLFRLDLLAEPLPRRYGAILSNPPYIADDVIPTLSPEVRREPRIALSGGKDGLIFYRALLDRHVSAVEPGGLLMFEIGYDQADAIRSLADRAGLPCEILRDLGGNPRCAILTRPR